MRKEWLKCIGILLLSSHSHKLRCVSIYDTLNQFFLNSHACTSYKSKAKHISCVKKKRKMLWIWKTFIHSTYTLSTKQKRIFSFLFTHSYASIVDRSIHIPSMRQNTYSIFFLNFSSPFCSRMIVRKNALLYEKSRKHT